MSNHDYISCGSKVTCQDPCKLKKADSRYPEREALTSGKEYTCTGVSANKQNFTVQDDAGVERTFKCYGDKYFAENRPAIGSFGSCAGFVASCAGKNDCTGGDDNGQTFQSQFYCPTGPDCSVVVDCLTGSCHQVFNTAAGAAGGAICKTFCTSSARCEALSTTCRNKTSPNCPGA